MSGEVSPTPPHLLGLSPAAECTLAVPSGSAESPGLSTKTSTAPHDTMRAMYLIFNFLVATLKKIQVMKLIVYFNSIYLKHHFSVYSIQELRESAHFSGLGNPVFDAYRESQFILAMFQVLKSHLWLRLPVGQGRSDNHVLLMMAMFNGPSLLQFQGRSANSPAGGSCCSVRLSRSSNSRPAGVGDSASSYEVGAGSRPSGSVFQWWEHALPIPGSLRTVFCFKS